MLNATAGNPSQTAEDRESRVQALLGLLRPQADQVLRQMAEHLVDLPEGKAFGQVEYDLRDLAHDLATSSHQAGLQAGKKGGTWGPAPSAPTAPPTPASRAFPKKPGLPPTATSPSAAPITPGTAATRGSSRLTGP